MHADIHENVVIRPDSLTWEKSDKFEKSTLDQVDWESSFLKLEPECQLGGQALSEGEEYLVLEGSLLASGESYPAGSYFRYPTDSEVELSSGEEGALIFAKKGHFKASDKQPVALKQSDQAWRQGMVTGLSVMPLYQHGHESTALVKWAPNTQFNPHIHPGGEEIIVLEGTFHDEFGSYPRGTWLRNKPYSQHTPYTESDGALIYVKTGHLEPKKPL